MSDDPWGSKIGKELADITRRAFVPVKWPCWLGHKHETPEEARDCIDKLLGRPLAEKEDLMAAVREIARSG